MNLLAAALRCSILQHDSLIIVADIHYVQSFPALLFLYNVTIYVPIMKRWYAITCYLLSVVYPYIHEEQEFSKVLARKSAKFIRILSINC